MATMLLIEAFLVCVLALPVGWVLWRARGGESTPAAGETGFLKKIPADLLTFWGAVLLVVGLPLLLAWLFFWRNPLSRHNLPANFWHYSFSYPGGAVLALEVLLWMCPLLLAVVYLVGGRASLARALRVVVLIGPGTVLLAALAMFTPSAVDIFGLGLGVFLMGLSIAYYIAWWGRATMKAPLLLSWVGFYGLCVLIAFTIGRLGVLFIFLPAVLAFFIALYVFGALVLPVATAQERWSAFRSLLTFALSTNFPYYVIEDWHTREQREQSVPEPRVAGNPFSKYFSGPGIVLNDANHAAVLWSGVNFRVAPPGLTFTGPFEQLYAAVDLRPQLRTTIIEAETADGIVTKTLVFMPHRIATGGQPLQLGASYPYDGEAVLRAVCDNAYVEHHFSRDAEQLAEEKLERKSWDALTLMFAPPILKELILARTCDELHKPGTTRAEIAQEFVRRLHEQLAAVGIEMVGGGLSNINVPDEVFEQRIANWEARWKRQIEIELGKEEAEIAAMLDPIWAEAQLAVYTELADILRQAGALATDAIAFQLVDALATPPMEQKNVQDLPKFMWSLMRRGRPWEGGR